MNNATLIERLRAALVVKFETQIDRLEAEVLSEVLASRGYADLVPSIRNPTSLSAKREFHEQALVAQTSDEGSTCSELRVDKGSLKLSVAGAVEAEVVRGESAAIEVGLRLRRRSGRHAEIIITKVTNDGIWLDRQVRWPDVTRRTRINSHEVSAFLSDYEVVAGDAN